MTLATTLNIIMLFSLFPQVGMLAKKFHFTGLAREAPKLSLPGKLVFPR